MVTLAKRFKSLSPDTVDSYTLPTTNANVGGASVLFAKQPDEQQMVNVFLGITPAPAAPGQPARPNVLPGSVRIRVLNGAGVSGLAGKVATELQSDGFVIGGRGDADSFHYVQSIVRYGPGQQDKATLVQSVLTGGAELKPDASLVGTDVVLVLGSNFGGVQHLAVPTGPAGSTAGSSTTSVAPSTTSTIPPAPGSTAAANGKNPAASC
jgi:hypothetical protein